MEYNDNDYEGQNLHLAGEDSSKVSSVLCPYALPKFDFDDNLQGHLRFDSLVENEVFLGIASQEDNQWIEDFSRGNSGIQFRTSAAESCSWPRRNNVWSEATSSESVEMLLKAVGQEEMVPGEAIVEETDPGDQYCGMMEPTETNLKQSDKIVGVKDPNQTLTPGEHHRDASVLNQSAEVLGVHTECTLPAEGVKDSLEVNSENSSLGETRKKLRSDTVCINDGQGEPSNSRDKMREILSLPGLQNDNTESSLQKVTVSFGELNDLDKVCDFETVSLSCLDKDICKRVEEDKKELNKDDEMLGGSDAETVNKKLGSAIGVASEIGNKLDEGSSVSIQAEGRIERTTVGRKADALEIFSKSELKKASAISSPDGQGSSIDKEDIHHGSNNLLEASPTTFEASTLSEVQGNPSEQDNETLVNPANKLDNLTVTSLAGECVGENPIIEDMKDASDVIGMHTDDDEDHNGSSLLSVSMQINGEPNTSMQTDSLKCDQGLSAGQKGDEKSQFVWNDMSCNDNMKEVGSTISVGGVKENVDSVPGSASKILVGDHPVLNTEMEDTNLASQVEDRNEELELPLNDEGSVHEKEETELKVPEEPRLSILGATLKMADKPTLVSEPQKAPPCESAVEAGFKKVDQPIPEMETADAATYYKASQKSSENLEACHVSETIVQEGDGAESASVGKPMDEKIERNHGATSLIDPVTGGSAEIDQSNQVSSGGISCHEHAESERDKQESLQGHVAENVHKSEGEMSAHLGSKDVSNEDGTFTFDVGPLACQSKGGESSQSFPNIQVQKISLAVEGSLSTSNNRQVDAKVVQETSHGNPLALDGRAPPGALKGPSERKARRSIGKSVKESGKKGVKETIPLKQNESGDKSHVSLSPSVTGQLMQFETGNVERSTSKASGIFSDPTSNLPDLNTSAPASVLFHQPFTDLQQVQLRAQIFVYGSLIQGAAPDEACMVSAFDGGRSIWEHSWRSCVERISHNKKSQGNISETPVQSRSVAKASDQASKHGLSQSKVTTSSAGRASGKASLSPAFNPKTHLSSPLWNISTPSGDGLPSSNVGRSAIFDYLAASPVHPYQTPPIRSFFPSTTSWPSQAPFPGSWVSSSQSSSFDIGSQYPVFPVTEPVKLTPVKELSMPNSSGAKNASPIPVAHSGVSSTLGVPFSLVDMKKTSVSSGQNSTGTKTRKRKKTSGAEDLLQNSAPAAQRDLVSAPVLNSHLSKKAPVVETTNQFSLLARSQAETVSALNVSSHYSTSVTVTTPSTFMPKSNADNFFVAASQSISSDNPSRGEINMEKRVTNLEDFSKVEEAKLQAEAAASHAATSVSHCQGVWSQLDKLKSAGLTSDAEAMLASAAVTIAAAASVAKAAAAAAQIASKAAVQAKQMADDAVIKHGTANATINNNVSLPMFVNNLGNATPASILKGGDGDGSSSSIISAAREAARKKVEVASAATRHAENLDAIVKAAELAAKAVSQAGKVVAMGDPLPLIELAEAGPDGHWQVSHAPSLQVSEPKDMNINRNESNNNNVNQRERPDKETVVQSALNRNITDDLVMAEDSLITSVKHRENDTKAQKDRQASDSAKAIGIVSESDIESISKSPIHDPNGHDPNGSTAIIKEGCLVEVLKDRGALNKVWYSANVLSLKDGEALVHYTKLQSGEGSEELEEWVPLAAEGDKAPIIRIPHHKTFLQLERTRKRSRAAVKDYAWSVGDRVDAWVQDCWHEGVITEKDEKDETSLSVHFPAQADTSLIKAWNLRPTLIWSDGQWIEWSRLRQNGSSQGDTPQEKRLKRGSAAIESKWKGKMSKDIEFVELRTQEEPRLLPLSANEKVFSIGDTTRTMRSGLQKDGSRVVFGVPKPGKKRKFMDVSKHYVSDKSNKSNVPSDSVKLANYLMPQGSGSRGWKNGSKIDSKEKQAAESKSKVLNSGKPPIPSRMLSRKDDSTYSKDENESASSQETLKRAPEANNKSDRPDKGKLIPAGRKPANNDANDNSAPDVGEPRRSNRRIQPTSRLLEGLQSSLIISKVPTSQDKIHRNFSKGTFRRE